MNKAETEPFPDFALYGDEQTQGKRAGEIRRRLVGVDAIDAVLTSNYMVKGWLDRNCLSMLYGPSNAGKTFVALDIAMHIAAGKSWRGLRVNGGPVLYIAAEGGAGIRNRLAAIKHDRPDMACALHVVAYLCGPAQAW